MFRPLHPALQPYKPTEGDPFDEVKAAHLLQRAGFGGTPEEIAKVVQLGPQKAVDWLMDFPDAPIEESTPGGGPDLSSIEGYPQSFAEIRKLMQGKTAEERKEFNKKIMAANREAIGATMGWWLNRMTHGPFPLQEKLTLFWHGHFTTSARDEKAASLMWNQNELLRRMAAGNFREFVRQISRDPAMLDFLNNSQNRKEHPNENYARELMELFTLGRDQYTENDIKQSARAFTGWTHDGDQYVFQAREHDTGVKTFFGRSGNFNGDDIIEIILQHRACAPYIASRLWNYFAFEPNIGTNMGPSGGASGDPQDVAMIESLGDVMRENKWELRPVIRTMLTSAGFYSDRAIGTQIKSPIQLVIGTIRNLGIETPRWPVMISQLTQMGQIPLQPPNVKGWPGGRLWINTSTMFVRYNTGVFLAGGDMPALGGKLGPKGKNAPIIRPAQLRGANTHFEPNEPGNETAEQVVVQWVDRLVQRPVESDKLRTLVAALGDQPSNPQNVKKMIQLILSMPDYQLC
jgi:hypothetical protein